MNSIALPHSCSSTTLESGHVVLLKQTGLLSLEGDDAVSFIHGQLSNDIDHLGSNQARLAAYCNPQGRMLALFHAWKSAGKVWLTVPLDILPHPIYAILYHPVAPLGCGSGVGRGGRLE